MRRERGEQRVGEKDSVVDGVGFQAESLEVGLDVKGCPERGRRAGEVGVEGEVAEVGGDGVVAGGREEQVLVVKEIVFVILVPAGSGGGVVAAAVEGVKKSQGEEGKNKKQKGERRF